MNGEGTQNPGGEKVMQSDMHYCATFCMAVAAGIEVATAKRIATASQWVDELLLPDHVLCDLESEAVSMFARLLPFHGSVPVPQDNTKGYPQFLFHFFPGCTGNTPESQWICVKDSQAVRRLLQLHAMRIRQGQEDAPELAGIAAHVYLDTFSHYGFVGFSHPMNRVDLDSVSLGIRDLLVFEQVRSKWERGRKKHRQAAKLEHGRISVGPFPDLPFLKWTFLYQDGRREWRDNSQLFLEACQKLYLFFSGIAHDLGGPGKPVPFEVFRQQIEHVIHTEALHKERQLLWTQQAQNGIFSDGKSLMLPPCPKPASPNAGAAAPKSMDLFLSALEQHYESVMRDVLPQYGVNMPAF